jgi:hypothetical protein
VSEANRFFISLDWLSCTFKEFDHVEDFLSRYAPSQESTPITPQHGYKWGRLCKNGVCVFGNPDRHDMGVHVVFSGSALRRVEQSGTTCRSLVSEVIRLRGKVSRLDLAKDCHDGRINLGSIIKAGIDNRYVGTAQTCNERTDNRGGKTLYIGSRQSDRFARIYDKGVETGTDENWLRYEFELKGDVAKQVARILSMNETNWDEVFNTMAKKFFYTVEGFYEDWLQGGSMPGLPKIEKQTDREAWIFNQVIKAVSEHLAEHPDSKAVEALYFAIRGTYQGQERTTYDQKTENNVL